MLWRQQHPDIFWSRFVDSSGAWRRTLLDRGSSAGKSFRDVLHVEDPTFVPPRPSYVERLATAKLPVLPEDGLLYTLYVSRSLEIR
jgi:hypothetical protein